MYKHFSILFQNVFRQTDRDAENLQRILTEMNSRRLLERQRPILPTLGQNLTDVCLGTFHVVFYSKIKLFTYFLQENYNQNEIFSCTTQNNNHIQVQNSFMLKQLLHQPLNNTLQSQRSMWPDPVAIQNKSQQLEEVTIYSSSCRTPPFSTLSTAIDNQSGLVNFESRLNKTQFAQSVRNKFNQTPNSENLGKLLSTLS